MEITLNDHRKIFDIQKEFSEMFPYLKLEFYSKSSKKGGAPSTNLMKHISKRIAECRTIHTSGNITIQPNMTISELEQSFRDVYGLSIEVFRKSANEWLETKETNDWTLDKQNAEAGSANKLEEVI
ncbi:MAG TPA: hypothetical protein VK809_09920 [Bacteroidia bacterium]|jgi:hypothetical protein|nr:hypothetical protein [Bacteroidia bacterium]